MNSLFWIFKIQIVFIFRNKNLIFAFKLKYNCIKYYKNLN